ncbi:Conserved_hypothetical protein [Hexamita inflata]|uniref:Uncharacterized protein n=1 Tax=Hexamita inflata TaxID=28002 RepID=A0AA86V112_9EUKA|nr:Conserved hypothetical protein [Hexamita inflata]
MACQNNMLLNGYQYNYCQKVNSLNNMRSQKHINLLKKADSAQLFMHTDLTKDTAMDLYLSHYNVNAFSLFGTNPGTQVIMDSQISISLSFEVYQGGMICVVCDVQISNCTLVFVAIGKYVSGILIEAKETVTVKDTSIQYRVTSQHSSGLVNLLNSSSVVIQIQDCTLTGSNLQDSAQSGYIAASVLKPLVIRISRFAVCVDGIQRIGGLEAAATFEGTESLRCDVCGVQKMVYGLCAEALENGKLVGGIIKCEHPFQFVLDKCQCISGYLLNNSVCINIVESINSLSQQEIDMNGLQQLHNYILIIQSDLDTFEGKISQNVSLMNTKMHLVQQSMENLILQNYSLIVSILDSSNIILSDRIHTNFTQLSNTVKTTYPALNVQLLQNMTELDQRIAGNMSYFNDDLLIELDTILDQLLAKILCTSQPGFQLQNNLCIQKNCPIGQKLVNGLCQCIIFNSVIINNICSCPPPLIFNQIQCECPDNSIFNGITCICAIRGQTLINGVCVCQVGAFVQNGLCTCGRDALNISNICKCPFNSVLSNGACTCTIVEQFMSGGVCKCIQGKVLVNGTCQSYIEIETATNLFTCHQNVLIISYNSQIVTNTVVQDDYLSGYAFSTQFSNALISIQNNIFNTIFKPLFSFNIVNNINVQIGIQTTNGGQIMTRSTTSITMNYVTITSKDATQITVTTGQLNIIQPGSTNANINNLLVNLNFAQSQGNITLIGTISGTMTITAYEVLGTYQSSQAVAMVGLIVKITVTSPNTTVTINQLCFKPTVFNIGNCSSYLFGSVIMSTLSFRDITLIIGNDNINVTTSIASAIGSQFQFGGLGNFIDSSNISIINLISDSKQQFITDYVQQTGFIVGSITSVTILSTLQSTNMCILQQLKSTTKEFYCLAPISNIDGNSSVKNVNIELYVQGLYFKYLGIIGKQSSRSIYSEIINIRSILSTIVESAVGQITGSVFGEQNALNCSIQNTSVNENITSQYSVGGFIGQIQSSNISLMSCDSTCNITVDLKSAGGIIGSQMNTNTYIIQTHVLQSFIKGYSNIAGFIGLCGASLISINDSTITNITIIGVSNIAVACYSDQNTSPSTLTVTNSKSIQISLNNDQKPNCESLKSIWTETQC